MTQYIVPSEGDLDDSTNPYRMSNMAECLCPDRLDSPGGEFLSGVRDALAESVRDDEFSEDSIHEIADDAPSIESTHTLWKEFVDLGAYHESPELGEWPSTDLDAIAHQALYQIAARLIVALLAEWEADDGEADDGDDE